MLLLCLRTSKILSLGVFVRCALGYLLLVQNIAYFMILLLTKHPSYSFSCLTHYICVFCRNEENEMKSKQFGPELRKICKEKAVVATIGPYGSDPRAYSRSGCTANSRCCRNHRGLFPTNSRCGHDHNFPYSD